MRQRLEGLLSQKVARGDGVLSEGQDGDIGGHIPSTPTTSECGAAPLSCHAMLGDSVLAYLSQLALPPTIRSVRRRRRRHSWLSSWGGGSAQRSAQPAC